ncbi:cupin domain protein [delta proteobacterium NaphS2]|nr:cupin domain protein [delta proteobacterium NaphS2]
MKKEAILPPEIGPLMPEDPQTLVLHSKNLHWYSPGELGNPSRLALASGIPCLTMNLFYQELLPGGSSDMQRHFHESIHFVIEGNGYSVIEGHRLEWETGDMILTPPWTWHRHYNSDPDKPVRMLGIENSKLLDKLGHLNKREHVGMKDWEDLKKEGLA